MLTRTARSDFPLSKPLISRHRKYVPPELQDLNVQAVETVSAVVAAVAEAAVDSIVNGVGVHSSLQPVNLHSRIKCHAS